MFKVYEKKSLRIADTLGEIGKNLLITLEQLYPILL